MASTDTKPAPADVQDPWEAMTRTRKKRPTRKQGRITAAALAGALLVCGATTGITAVSLHGARTEAGQALSKAVEAYTPRQDIAPVLVGHVNLDPPLERDAMDAVLRDMNKAAVNNPGSDGTGKTFTRYAAAQASLTGSLRTLIETAAKHPGLEASKDFTAARTTLEGAGPGITEAAAAYNDAAGRYNSTRESFPGNMLAPLLGHGKPWGTFTVP
ncbi:MAG TPA: LemA family protein [Arthrobacter sp.]